MAWIGRYRGWVVGLGYGAQLGFGLVTIITSSTTYAVVVLAVLSGTPWAGALIGAIFGLVRALPLVLIARGSTRARSSGRHSAAWSSGRERPRPWLGLGWRRVPWPSPGRQ